MATKQVVEHVQCFRRKKTTVDVTHCKRGSGLIKLNGCPIELFQPEILRFKIFEPVLLLGKHRFTGVDMRIRVKGGGHTSQIHDEFFTILTTLSFHTQPRRINHESYW